jgi:hypothetical protein
MKGFRFNFRASSREATNVVYLFDLTKDIFNIVTLEK